MDVIGASNLEFDAGKCSPRRHELKRELEKIEVRGGKGKRELPDYATGGKEVWYLVGLAPTLLLVLVALRAPLDSIDRIPALAEAIGFLCAYVPSFHAYIQPAPYSQATALYFVCAWALLLPQTAVWLFVISRYVDLDRLCAHGPRYFATLMVAWLLVAGGVFAALYWIPPASGFVDVCPAGWNRVGLAFFCSAGFLFVALGVGFVINAIITLTTISRKAGLASGRARSPSQSKNAKTSERTFVPNEFSEKS